MRKLFTILFVFVLLITSGCNASAAVDTVDTVIPVYSEQPTEPPGAFQLENRTIQCCNTVAEYQGKIYFTNNERLYVFDGKKTEVAFSPVEKGWGPVHFYIDDDKLVYIAEYDNTIHMRDMSVLNDASKEILYGDLFMDRYEYVDLWDNKEVHGVRGYNLMHASTFIVAEGHVFYKHKDGTMHCVTIDGRYDRRVYGDFSSPCYSHGYLYFYGNGLFRMRADGSVFQKITENIDGYIIAEDGSVILQNMDTHKFNVIFFKLDINNGEKKRIIELDYAGTNCIPVSADEDCLFLYQTDIETGNVRFLNVALNGGEAELILDLHDSIDDFSSQVQKVGEYFYFYSDVFCRVKTDGTIFQKIGPEISPLNPRV